MALPLLDAAARAFGDEGEAKMRVLAAAKAYELDELNIDQAAELAGMTKVGFLRILGKYQVSVLATDRLEEDAAVAARAAGR
jgi:hypothetical protein